MWTFDDMTRLSREACEAIAEYDLGLTVERNAHPSVVHPVFWLCHNGKHVGTVSVDRREIDGECRYNASKFHGGLPYTSKDAPSFKAAIWHAGTNIRDARHK